MCKSNKFGHGMENKLGHRGFGKLRDETHSREDMEDGQKEETDRR